MIHVYDVDINSVDMHMYVYMMIGMDWLKNYIVGLNYVRNVDPAPNRWSPLSINHSRSPYL